MCMLVLVLTIVPAMAQQGTKRLALVIGNDSYVRIPALVNARNDARVMADSLRKVNYQVTLALDQDYRSMLNTLRNFKQAVNGGDEVVVFFSGHGVQLGAANYLLPVDMNPDSEEQVKDEAIPLQRLLDDIAERRARFSLAIVDACRNNPFKSHGRSIGGSRGLAPTSAATGQMVIFSAGTGQEALDSLSDRDPVKNGVFTRVFAKEMLAPDVPIDRVLKNVRLQVRDMAASVGREQVPAIYDQVAGDFFFLQTAAGAPVNLATVQRTAPAGVATAAVTPVAAAPAPAPLPAPAVTVAAATQAARQRPADTASRPGSAGASPGKADDDDLVNIWNQIAAGRGTEDGRRGAARPAERTDTSTGRAINLPPTSAGLPATTAPQPLKPLQVDGSAALTRISSTATIVLGVRDDAPPLSFSPAAGRFSGFQVDVCLRLVEDLRQGLGLPALEVKYRAVNSSSDAIGLLTDGKIDLECGATVNTTTRQQSVAFGPTTYVVEARIVVKNSARITSVAQLAGKRLITVIGGTPGATLRQVPETAGLSFEELAGGDSAQTFMLLEAGAADAMLMDGATAAHLIAKSREPGAYRMLDPTLSAEPIAVALARDDPGFKAAVDQSIARILAGGETQRLYAQWFRAGSNPAPTVSRSTLAAWAEPNDRPAAPVQR